MNKNYIKLAALICLTVFAVNTAQAQLKDCNAFIQGNYVEVGVNYNGAYGSSTPPPSGYHPNTDISSISPPLHNAASCITTTTGFRLGFVADPDKDGWTTATPGYSPYMGDYFVPGIPFEGWSIMTSKQINCWNGIDSTGLFDSMMTGSNVRYTSLGSRRATEWVGSFDSLQITQRTILDTANTYFVIRVKIKNLSHVKRTNVYYFRSVDPDNDQRWPLGGFPTDNKIEFQNPNPSNLCVVTAYGRGYPRSSEYFALGTKDPRAKAFINSSWPRSGRLDSLHAELDTTFVYDTATIYNADYAIGLVYKIDSLPSIDSTILVMAYMFGSGTDLDKAVDDDGLFIEEEPASIGSLYFSNSIVLTPNPFQNELTVNGLEKNDKIDIYNIQGCKMKGEWTDNNSARTLNTSSLPIGLYIIMVRSENGVLKLRKTIQHN